MGSSGRIDILAYNPVTRKFVVFELKINYDKNVGHQAADYQDFIQDDFTKIHKAAFQKNKEALPHAAEIDDEEVEIVLIAKTFLPHQIRRARKESLVTLIEYNWFENGLFLLDYVTNAPEIKKGVVSLPPVNEPKQLDFWKRYYDKLKQTGKFQDMQMNSSASGHYTIAELKKGIGLGNFCNPSNGRFTVRVDMKKKDESMFDFLKSQRDKIESEIGEKLDWKLYHNGYNIKLQHPIIPKNDLSDTTKIEETLDWLVEYAVKFWDVFSKIINEYQE